MSEQSIASRKEGTALANVGMIISQIDSLYLLGFITREERDKNRYANYVLRDRIIKQQKQRMIAHGTYKGSEHEQLDIMRSGNES